MRLHWEEAPIAERSKICAFYAEYIKRHEGQSMTIKQLDEAWTGCWFDVIRFTFGPDAWDMK